MVEDYSKSSIPPSGDEKLLANRASHARVYVLKDQSVAKKTKTVSTENPTPIEAASSADVKIGKVKPRRASTSSQKVGSSKKGARKVRSSAPPGPTDEEIRIRAYFISERRRRFGLPGDANSDWIEAKRQLLSETGPR
jgi:hypothetical protein